MEWPGNGVVRHSPFQAPFRLEGLYREITLRRIPAPPPSHSLYWLSMIIYRPMRDLIAILMTFIVIASLALVCSAQENRGYYRFPAIHGNTIAFTSDGDLWHGSTACAVALRL